MNAANFSLPIRTSSPGWLATLAKAYRSKTSVFLLDDTRLGSIQSTRHIGDGAEGEPFRPAGAIVGGLRIVSDARVSTPSPARTGPFADCYHAKRETADGPYMSGVDSPGGPGRSLSPLLRAPPT